MFYETLAPAEAVGVYSGYGQYSLERGKSVQSLDRFMQILRALSMSHNTSLRLTDIAAGVGLTKPTALRLLEALCEHGLVRYDPGSRVYSLGQELVFLGLSASRTFAWSGLVRPALEELARETGDGVFCGIRSGNHIVCTDRVFGDYPVKAEVFPVGGRRPLGVGSSGMAILLGLPREEAEEVCALNAEEIRKYPGLSAERLLGEAEAGRRQGYCFTEGHMVRGISALGAPVRNLEGAAVGAVSVVGLAARFEDGRKERLVPLLLDAAQKAGRAVFQSALIPPR